MPQDVRMKGFGDRATVAEVVALIERRVQPLGLERVPFSLSLGRILGEDITATKDVPPQPKSAMDGYAVRAADLPGRLRVIGQVMAADRFDGTVGPGEALRIMTGAAVPDGADTVVMVEAAKLEGDVVAIDRAEPAGTHVLEAGADLRAGSVVLPRGRRIRPQDVSLLASVGALEVSVQRRPRVRIVPTGTELLRVGSVLPDAKTSKTGSRVIESNSFLLGALAARDGAEPLLHPILPDDPAMLRRVMVEPGADVVVLTGGSSTGAEDLAAPTLESAGELAIHGVHVKPASPTGIGFIGATAVVLAPGYPVASYVAWDLFVLPILQRMTNAPLRLPYRTTTARMAAAYTKPAQRVEVQRVAIEDGRAKILPGGAALLSTTTRADGFLLLPAGESSWAEGQEVTVHLYD